MANGMMNQIKQNVALAFPEIPKKYLEKRKVYSHFIEEICSSILLFITFCNFLLLLLIFDFLIRCISLVKYEGSFT